MGYSITEKDILDDIDVSFVSRQEIIDRYLDRINDGYELSDEEREMLEQFSKTLK
jgi:hypothetical protein